MGKYDRRRTFRCQSFQNSEAKLPPPTRLTELQMLATLYANIVAGRMRIECWRFEKKWKGRQELSLQIMLPLVTFNGICICIPQSVSIINTHTTRSDPPEPSDSFSLSFSLPIFTRRFKRISHFE